MEIREIDYASPEYQATLALRNRVMRLPLGLSIYDEDFSKERQAHIVGAFEKNQLIGVGVLSKAVDVTVTNVDYLCVDSTIQSKGIGKSLLRALEDYSRQLGAKRVALEARVSAKGFYERCGYRGSGEIYLMSHAPVPHLRMNKKL